MKSLEQLIPKPRRVPRKVIFASLTDIQPLLRWTPPRSQAGALDKAASPLLYAGKVGTLKALGENSSAQLPHAATSRAVGYESYVLYDIYVCMKKEGFI